MQLKSKIFYVRITYFYLLTALFDIIIMRSMFLEKRFAQQSFAWLLKI